MQQEAEQDRTEPATPYKLEEARKQGQVAKSLDVNSLLAVMALLAALTFWGAASWRQLAEGTIAVLTSAGQTTEAAAVWLPLQRMVADLFGVLLPFAAVGAILAIGANLLQTGPIFSAVPLKPKFERLNPVAGFKRVFNKRVLFEGVKSILKLAFFSAVVYTTLSGFWPDIPSLYTPEGSAQLLWITDHAGSLLFRLVLALILVALLDLAFVRWQFSQQMRMSTREIKEEVKRREGDPHIRARIRQLQRENLKQAGSLNRVKDADVLITNPEHFAVALVYDRSRMDAPCVVAKGQDLWAQELKQAARRAGVPMRERRSLAQLLFRSGQIDRPIPVQTYLEVARLYGEEDIRRRSYARLEVRT